MAKLLVVATILLQGTFWAMASEIPEAILDPSKAADPGVEFLRLGKYEEARALYRSMLAGAETRVDDYDAIGKALVRLGTTEYLAGRPQAALRYFERAVEAWKGEPRQQAATLNDVAQAKAALRQWTGAEEALRRAIELTPEDGRAWHLMGQIHYLTGRRREAEADYRTALQLGRQDDSVHIAATLNDLAVLLEEQGRVAEGIGYLERAVATMAPGQAHGRMVVNLGTMYWKTGRREKGAPLVEQGLTELEKATGGGHPDLDNAREVYASMLRDLGRKKEAKAVEARAVSGLR